MPIAHEFSRVYATDRLSADGTTFTITATPEERSTLARRLELLALDRLHATGTIVRRTPGGLIEVTGRLSAATEQRCVVTLEPVPGETEVEFQRFFAPSLDVPAEIEIDPEATLLEPLDGDLIDVGEIVAEELSLALDPYPRAGAASYVTDADEGVVGPFAALASLRRH